MMDSRSALSLASARPRSTVATAALIAVVSLTTCIVIGSVVSNAPPHGIDLVAREESGRFVRLALALTAAGRFVPYATLCSLALVIGLVWRAWLAAALVEICLILAVWRASDALKEHFHRMRPVWWYRELETSYAYPSGHAALSLAFYGFAAYAIVRSSLPLAVKRIAVFVCGVMIVGIGWSRLALGAHFPTDLIGGYLLALTALAIATVLYDRIMLAARR